MRAAAALRRPGARLDNRGGEAGGGGRAAGRVDSARQEGRHILEQLRLGARRVAHDGHVDVAAQIDALRQPPRRLAAAARWPSRASARKPGRAHARACNIEVE